jgi:hypothetical protein
MKLIFNGWSRTVYTHEHDVLPIKGGPNRRAPIGKANEPLCWDNTLSARGRINNISLTGDFLVEFQFEASELRNWLSLYVKESPKDAIRLLAEMQGEAMINLAIGVDELD